MSETEHAPESSSSATSSIPRTDPSFVVYRPSNLPATSPPPPLSDDYFTPTASDLKAAQATLTARTRALVDAPLELRATREAKEREKRERWPQTRIRIRFSDRTQLEKVFPSTDKIRSVYAFVRGCLREDVKPIKFILYQSPPKRDLKVSDPEVRDLSLAQLQLAPSSILLLRFEDESLNHINVPAPLSSPVLSQAIDLPLHKPIDDSSSSPDINRLLVPQPQQSVKGTTDKKLPKWFKLGQKK
ncbi:hypothetical protein BDQ17DRAFT_1307839 [Cyathus striatus]|nr:hypothetical protein BDQ17DRAFT_1307839 [Cyathus striatus]